MKSIAIKPQLTDHARCVLNNWKLNVNSKCRNLVNSEMNHSYMLYDIWLMIVVPNASSAMHHKHM